MRGSLPINWRMTGTFHTKPIPMPMWHSWWQLSPALETAELRIRTLVLEAESFQSAMIASLSVDFMEPRRDDVIKPHFRRTDNNLLLPVSTRFVMAWVGVWS